MRTRVALGPFWERFRLEVRLGGFQSSRRTPFSQSGHRRLVSLVERHVRLVPPRVGEGTTRDGGLRRSVHVQESLWAMTPARAALRHLLQRSRDPRGIEDRKRIRVPRI